MKDNYLCRNDSLITTSFHFKRSNYHRDSIDGPPIIEPPSVILFMNFENPDSSNTFAVPVGIRVFENLLYLSNEYC